jgi:hypothetical protein
MMWESFGSRHDRVQRGADRVQRHFDPGELVVRLEHHVAIERDGDVPDWRPVAVRPDAQKIANAITADRGRELIGRHAVAVLVNSDAALILQRRGDPGRVGPSATQEIPA